MRSALFSVSGPVAQARRRLRAEGAAPGEVRAGQCELGVGVEAAIPAPAAAERQLSAGGRAGRRFEAELAQQRAGIGAVERRRGADRVDRGRRLRQRHAEFGAGDDAVALQEVEARTGLAAAVRRGAPRRSPWRRRDRRRAVVASGWRGRARRGRARAAKSPSLPASRLTFSQRASGVASPSASIEAPPKSASESCFSANVSLSLTARTESEPPLTEARPKRATRSVSACRRKSRSAPPSQASPASTLGSGVDVERRGSRDRDRGGRGARRSAAGRRRRRRTATPLRRASARARNSLRSKIRGRRRRRSRLAAAPRRAPSSRAETSGAPLADPGGERREIADLGLAAAAEDRRRAALPGAVERDPAPPRQTRGERDRQRRAGGAGERQRGRSPASWRRERRRRPAISARIAATAGSGR